MYSILILEKHIIVNINSFFRINQTSAFKTEKKKIIKLQKEEEDSCNLDLTIGAEGDYFKFIIYRSLCIYYHKRNAFKIEFLMVISLGSNYSSKIMSKIRI